MKTPYRYVLARAWDPDKPLLGWFCLNPSTADATVDDPTTRKLRGFAERWGFGRYLLVNLFPMRATNPRALIGATRSQRAGDPALNDILVRACVLGCDEIVLAWGAHGANTALTERVDAVLGQIAALRAEAPKPVWHLGLTKAGQPRHPLYLSYQTERQAWPFEVD